MSENRQCASVRVTIHCPGRFHDNNLCHIKVRVQVCMYSVVHACVLFEHQRGLRAVLLLKVQPVGQVVLPPQEGVEIV